MITPMDVNPDDSAMSSGDIITVATIDTILAITNITIGVGIS